MQAIDCYRKVIDITPETALAHLNLAVALYHIGEPEEAITNYLKTIELNPDCLEAYFGLSSLVKEAGMYEDARHYLSTLLSKSKLSGKDTISFYDKSLVVSWLHRRAIDLAWQIYVMSPASASSTNPLLQIVTSSSASHYPSLHLDNTNHLPPNHIISNNGYLIEESLLSARLCSEVIHSFADLPLMSNELIDLLEESGASTYSGTRSPLH